MPDGYTHTQQVPVKRLTASSAAVEAAQKRGFPAKQEAPPPDPNRSNEPNTDQDEEFGDLYRELRGFPAFGDPPRPLAIGVDRQIRDALGGRYRRKAIGRVLAWWTRLPEYIAAVAAGGQRINLDGSNAGDVSEAHRKKAVEQLTRRGMSPPETTHVAGRG